MQTAGWRRIVAADGRAVSYLCMANEGDNKSREELIRLTARCKAAG
jgi:hypothetical protein